MSQTSTLERANLIFDNVYIINDSVNIGILNHTEYLLDNNYQIISDGYRVILESSHKGYYMARDMNDKAGIIDSKGNTIIENKYKAIMTGFLDQFIVCNNKYGVVNSNKEVIIPQIYSYISNDIEDDVYFCKCDDGKHFVLDTAGNTVISGEFIAGYGVGDGLFIMSLWDDQLLKKVLIKKGNIILSDKYDMLISLSCGLYKFVRHSDMMLFGAIDNTGKVIIKDEYRYIERGYDPSYVMGIKYCNGKESLVKIGLDGYTIEESSMYDKVGVDCLDTDGYGYYGQEGDEWSPILMSGKVERTGKVNSEP